MRPPYSLQNAWQRLSAGWNEFFHGQIDARVPALVRIAYAAVLLVNLTNWYPNLILWFGEQGLLSREVAHRIRDARSWSLLDWLPADNTTLWICYVLIVFHTLCLLLGLLTRANAVCVFVWLVSFQNRNPLILDGEDTVFRLLAFFLMFMPCGAGWSLDAWILRKLRPRPAEQATAAPRLVPAWGLRLLQLQMGLIFFSAGLCKLQGPSWFDGTALYYVAQLDEFGKYPLPAGMFEVPWLVRGMTWGVVIAELVAPLLIWFRETRRATLLVVVAFHLANEYSMHLFLFHGVMLAGWLAFLLPQDWAWLTSLIGRGSYRGTGGSAPAPAKGG